MIMLQRWPVQWRENGHVMEVASLMERSWFMLHKWSVQWTENGHTTEEFNRGSIVVREVVTLKKGEWLCYGGGHFYGGSMVMLQKRSCLMKGEWSC